MQRILRALLVATLLFSAPLNVGAQIGDIAYFESFDGLQRIVARSWMAPATSTTEYRSWELDEQGTPIPGTLQVSTPAATPAPSSGVGMLAIFVYLFDSDDNAADAWDRLDADLEKTVVRDPRAPMMEDLSLDGIGERAHGYMGDLSTDGVAVRHTFATVQDGPFVYSISGMFSGMDGAGLTREYAEALVGAPMNRMAEQFSPDGTSRGGIWSKLNGVQPGMPEGSTVVDLEVWPIPDGMVPEPASITMQDVAAFPGVEEVVGVTYLPDDPEMPGPSRIEAWILQTNSIESGSIVVYAVADALGAPVAVIASENGIEDDGERVLVAKEGFVTDDAMPEGNASVVAQQVGTTIYAVVVYAPDDTTRRVADNVVASMIEAAANGDVHNRFPQEGDGVLRGLVPADLLPATPVASPEADIAG